jgi:hypothetical protein
MQVEFPPNNQTQTGVINLNKKGQMLIEAMIALSIMLISLLGIFYLISQSLGLYRVAYESYVAANLAAEGIEVVKNIVDTNVLAGRAWNQGLARDGRYGVQYDSLSLDTDSADRQLLYDSASGLYGYRQGGPTNFKRVIVIKNISPDEIQVNSIVSWKNRGGLSLDINLEDHFFNWRQ